MPKDDLVYVGHMLDTAKKALEKVQNKDRSAYDADENLRMALVHLIQVLGEAARDTRQVGAPSHPPAVSLSRNASLTLSAPCSFGPSVPLLG